MKELQQISIGNITYVFTENPEKDITKIQELYEKEDREAYLGYEMPRLDDFEFLGKKYKAISFWHDNDDVVRIELDELYD